jgi:hypothetical protein
MFALLICVYLFYGQPWRWSPIHWGIPSNTRPAQGTHENWRAAQALLAIATEVLGRHLPTIAYLTPTYAPMVRALIAGCTTLAVRVPSGSKSGRRHGAQSLEDAAEIEFKVDSTVSAPLFPDTSRQSPSGIHTSESLRIFLRRVCVITRRVTRVTERRVLEIGVPIYRRMRDPPLFPLW